MPAQRLRWLLVAVLALACTTVPPPQVDVGPTVARVPGASHIAWTPDGTALVYQAEPPTDPGTGTLGVLDVASGATRTLRTDVTWSWTFKIAADSRSVLVMDTSDPEHRLLRVAIDGSPDVADVLAADVAAFLPAPDGHSVAVAGWTTNNLTLLDTASGTSRALGQGWPRLFAPHGAQLVVSVPRPTPPTDGGPSDDYFVVDVVTGARQPFVASDLLLGPVLAWAPARPRTIAATDPRGRLLRVDVGSDARFDLTPEAGVLVFLDTPASSSALFAGTEVCLKEAQDLEGDSCAGYQTTYSRIDPATGTHVPVARTPRAVPAAVSPDGRVLALVYDGAIHLKDVP